ncbi:MAG: hypothetical protein Ct9H300mP11_11110 [Chloroflexota bacterium]|nr:MAG: hypothetical protein Ct9H300mP11_11110 [Chloroflexota bacterium]
MVSWFQSRFYRFPRPETETDVSSVPLYLKMALACQEWDANNNLGLVVGATVPEQLKQVRASCPTLPFLIPGVGAQGGDLEAAVRQGGDSRAGEL